MDVTRRDFLKALGVGAGAVAAGCYADNVAEAPYLQADPEYMGRMLDFVNLKNYPREMGYKDAHVGRGDPFLMGSEPLDRKEAEKLYRMLSENYNIITFEKSVKSPSRPKDEEPFRDSYVVEKVWMLQEDDGVRVMIGSNCRNDVPFREEGNYSFKAFIGGESFESEDYKVKPR